MSYHVALPLAEAYEFAEANGLRVEASAIRGMVVHPTLRKNNDETVRKAAFVDLFTAKDVFKRFVRDHWPAGATDKGAEKCRYYRMRLEKNVALLGRAPNWPWR